MVGLQLLKGVAALHRGGISFALAELKLRDKLSKRRYNRKTKQAVDVATFAHNLALKSQDIAAEGRNRYARDQRKLLAAENLVLNARDDLNKFTANV